jgi:endonuclease YncB( thermonuclease family)
MRRTAYWVAAVIVLAALTGCDTPRWALHPDGQPPVASSTYEVDRIVDGVTLVVRDDRGKLTRVRVRGIDAPPAGHAGAVEATERLRAMFPPGSRVIVYPHARDRRGRTVADLSPTQ